jgi:hypothetical protein
VLAESAAATDAFFAAAAPQFVTITESVVAGDSIVGRFLWEIIDNSQTVVWANVGTVQTPSWTQVGTVQTAGWTPVGNSQTPGWGSINTSATPGGVPVDTLPH